MILRLVWNNILRSPVRSWLGALLFLFIFLGWGGWFGIKQRDRWCDDVDVVGMEEEKTKVLVVENTR